MLRAFLVVSFILAISTPSASADGPYLPPISVNDIGTGHYRLNVTTGLFGNPLELTVDRSNLPTLPVWSERDANPPVSAKRAIEIASAFASQRLRTTPKTFWELESCALVPLDSKIGIWCWRATLNLTINEMHSGEWPQIQVLVLMDGSVIAPTDPKDKQRGASEHPVLKRAPTSN